jgi:hypothetical protein
MIFEKRHMYRKEKCGIKGIPEKSHTPERQAELSDWIYMGFISEYEYLGHEAAMTDTSVVAIKRDLYTTVFNPNPVPKINIDGIGGYHGDSLNTNCAPQLNRKDLISLLEYMGENDTIVIMNVDYNPYSLKYFREVRKSLKEL